MQQTKRVQLDGTTIHILGCTHGAHRNPMISADENIEKVDNFTSKLKAIKPNVIYVEVDPTNVSKMLENSRPEDGPPEIVAVANYTRDKQTEVVGVDSQSLKEMGRSFNQQEVTEWSRGMRDEAMVFGILGHLVDNNPQNAVFLVGHNHVDSVIKSMQSYKNT